MQNRSSWSANNCHKMQFDATASVPAIRLQPPILSIFKEATSTHKSLLSERLLDSAARFLSRASLHSWLHGQPIEQYLCKRTAANATFEPVAPTSLSGNCTYPSSMSPFTRPRLRLPARDSLGTRLCPPLASRAATNTRHNRPECPRRNSVLRTTSACRETLAISGCLMSCHVPSDMCTRIGTNGLRCNKRRSLPLSHRSPVFGSGGRI